jgi:hypothetical protein
LQGQFAGVPYAIFQCKPRAGVDEASNNTDLIAELKLLIHGQYFAESFAKRALIYGVQIPGKPHLTVLHYLVHEGSDIRWNALGAFVGTVTDTFLDDTTSLVFETFLAAPLLDMSNLYSIRKFSGSTTAGRSIDIVGSAIDAYAHHVLVDSDGLLVLTDLQGMSRKCYIELGFDYVARRCWTKSFRNSL